MHGPIHLSCSRLPFLVVAIVVILICVRYRETARGFLRLSARSELYFSLYFHSVDLTRPWSWPSQREKFNWKPPLIDGDNEQIAQQNHFDSLLLVRFAPIYLRASRVSPQDATTQTLFKSPHWDANVRLQCAARLSTAGISRSPQDLVVLTASDAVVAFSTSISKKKKKWRRDSNLCLELLSPLVSESASQVKCHLLLSAWCCLLQLFGRQTKRL